MCQKKRKQHLHHTFSFKQLFVTKKKRETGQGE